jgi:hypothetical protein
MASVSPEINLYDELDLPECRICLEHGNTPLISPCNCQGTQKYIHLECLNRWRLENINNEKYTTCEICKREFEIVNTYQPEYLMCSTCPQIKFKYVLGIFFLYFFGGIIWCFDFDNNFKSMEIVSFNRPTPQFKIMVSNFKNIGLTGIAPFYYMALGAFFLSNAHIIFHIFIALLSINRKSVYFKKITPFLILYILNSANIYWGYIVFILTDSREIYLFSLMVFTANNYLNVFRLIETHNKIIKDMNSQINQQVILSLCDHERPNNNGNILNFEELEITQIIILNEEKDII